MAGTNSSVISIIDRVRQTAHERTLVEDRLLTAKQVAEQLQITEAWVHQQAREGDLPSIALGRYRRFRPSAVRDWIEAKSTRGRRS